MKEAPAIYLGKIIDKKNFRTFIYGPNGEKKLVESWDEFESSMQSGIWFATVEDALKTISKPEVHNLTIDELPSQIHENRSRKSKSKPNKEDDSVFEVTDGD